MRELPGGWGGEEKTELASGSIVVNVFQHVNCFGLGWKVRLGVAKVER